jgi:antitoxin component YwqK of YwqJK toxin-antitoxin module
MKKLLKFLFLIITTIFFIACDNNDGPFETRRENGHKVLYSGGKLAKGMIQSTWYDFKSGETVVTATYYVDKGIPAGNFTLYDQRGNLILSFEGKVEDNLFKGEMTLTDLGKANGQFNINPDWILEYDGSYSYIREAKTLPTAVLFNGVAETNLEEVTMKNGKRDGLNTLYSAEGNVNMEKFYDNGHLKRQIKYFSDGIRTTEYYKNGITKSNESKLYTGVIIHYSYYDEAGKQQGETIDRNDDGTLRLVRYFKDDSILGEIYIDRTISYLPKIYKTGIYKDKSFEEIEKEYNQTPQN